MKSYVNFLQRLQFKKNPAWVAKRDFCTICREMLEVLADGRD